MEHLLFLSLVDRAPKRMGWLERLRQQTQARTLLSVTGPASAKCRKVPHGGQTPSHSMWKTQTCLNLKTGGIYLDVTRTYGQLAIL